MKILMCSPENSDISRAWEGCMFSGDSLDLPEMPSLSSSALNNHLMLAIKIQLKIVYTILYRILFLHMRDTFGI